jgi:hypothetical protein
MSSVTLAFVDNTGKVTLVLNTDEAMVPSFTESAHINDVTKSVVVPGVNWTYDGTNFIVPPPLPVEKPIIPTGEVPAPSDSTVTTTESTTP